MGGTGVQRGEEKRKRKKRFLMPHGEDLNLPEIEHSIDKKEGTGSNPVIFPILLVVSLCLAPKHSQKDNICLPF